jgi:hypothetical protein
MWCKSILKNFQHSANHRKSITTYYDVYESYPKDQYPAHIKGDKGAQQAWWSREYDNLAGALHQVHW